MENEVRIGPLSPKFSHLWDHLDYGYRHILLISGRGKAKTMEVSRFKDYVMDSSKAVIVSARGNWINLDRTSYATFSLVTEMHGTKDNYEWIPTRNKVVHKETGSEDLYIGVNADPSAALKGIPRIDIFWGDEAQDFTEDAIDKAIPTVFRFNEKACCIWCYNPQSRHDAIFRRFPFDIERLKKEGTLMLEEGVIAIWLDEVDNPYFNDAMRKERESAYRNNPVRAANEWDGEFLGDECGALIPGEAVRACVGRDVGDCTQWVKLAGIDLGGTGDPTIVRLRQGRRFLHSKKYHESDHSILAPQIVSFLNQNDVDIAIGDGTGFGGSFFSFLRQQFGEKKVISVNFGGKAPVDGYENMRAYMGDKLRQTVISGCHIPDEPDLIEELSIVKGWKSKGVSYLDQKKNIKKYLGRSCDEFDAAGLTECVEPYLKSHQHSSDARRVHLVLRKAGKWNGR